MNIAIGRRTLKPSNKRTLSALVGAVAIAGVLAAVNTWGGFDSGSTQTELAPPAAVRPVAPATPEIRTHYYFVDSQAQADLLYQADLERQSSFPAGTDDSSVIHVIDVSTAEGQEMARLMQAEIFAAMELGHDVPVEFHDLTAGAAGPISAPPVVSTSSTSTSQAIPTYFYLVESDAEGAEILREDQLVQSMRFELGLPSDHRAEVINVSTLEGQQLASRVAADLMTLSDDPNATPSLIQIFDLTR